MRINVSLFMNHTTKSKTSIIIDIEEIKIIYKKSPRIVLGFIIGPRIVLGFIIGVRIIFMVLFLAMFALRIYLINVIYTNLVTYLTHYKNYLI